MPHSEYKHVPAIELELIVIANLIIIPPEITIMAHDSFKYKIMHVSLIHRINHMIMYKHEQSEEKH